MTRLRVRRRDGEAGFTTVELMVAISVLAVVTAGAMGLIVRAMQVSNQTTQRVVVTTDLQRSVERVTRNVRAADPISTATPTQLRVTVHDSAAARRVITYTLAGGTLSQRVQTYTSPTSAAASSDVTTAVVGGLTNTTVFTYTTATGTPWTSGSPATIAHVEVMLATSVNSRPVQLTSSAQVRNA